MRVAVALSGGIDSFTSALLLKQQGHEVIGVFMRVSEDTGGIEASRQAAEILGIPHIVLDLRAPFEELVVEPFLKGYLLGKTPNPCVLCNELVKFSLMKEEARRLGADAFATGHYVRKAPIGGKWALLRGRDRRRDQSYFLWRLTQKHLQGVLFPLGEMTKEEVRRIAEAHGMKAPVESREICFIKGDYRRFIEDRLGRNVKPGPIVDLKGRVLGWHSGVHRFTVGQRHGLGIRSEKPYYVVGIRGNEIVVGREEDLYRRRLRARGVNWISGEAPKEVISAEGQIRYRHQAAPCRAWMEGESLLCEFSEPQRAITPGQALVLYQGERVLGGGWIEEVL